jgi:hypothetical protein
MKKYSYIGAKQVQSRISRMDFHIEFYNLYKP